MYKIIKTAGNLDESGNEYANAQTYTFLVISLLTESMKLSNRSCSELPYLSQPVQSPYILKYLIDLLK